VNHWSRDCDHHLFGRVRIIPIELAGLRIKPNHAVSRSANQHAPPGLCDNDWRAVRSSIWQSAPALFTSEAVKGNQTRVLAADLDDDEIAFDQRRGRDSPDGKIDIVLFVQVVAPFDRSGSGVETVQMALRSKRVSKTSIHGDCRTRPIRIANPGIIAFIRIV